MNPWLMGDMEDVFKTMKATGRGKFSLEEVQAFVQQATNEAAEKHAQGYEKDHSEIPQPVTWEQAAEGLEIPQQQPNQETEMER